MSFSCVDPTELLARYEPFSGNISAVLPEQIGPDNYDFPKVSVRTGQADSTVATPDLSYNPFSGIGSSIFDSADAMELAAIQFVYGIIDPHAVYLALNAGPGGWIQYIQYAAPETYGFGVAHRERNNWEVQRFKFNMADFILHYGDDATGDLNNPRNREASSKWIMNYVASTNEDGMPPEGVDLVLANGTMLLAELWTGVNCLSKNGNLVIRLVQPDAPTTMQACYLTSQIFERSTLFKPISSHPAKPECFLVCQHLQMSGVDDYLDILGRILDVSTDPLSIIESVPDRFGRWYEQMLGLIDLNQQRYLTETPPQYDFARVHILWNLPLVDRTYAPWHFQLKRRNYPETVLYPEGVVETATSTVGPIHGLHRRDRVLEEKLRGVLEQYQNRHVPKNEIYDGHDISSLIAVMAERKYPYPRISTFMTPEAGTIPEWIGDYFTEKENVEWYRYGNTVRKAVLATLTDPAVTEFDYATLRAHLDLPTKTPASRVAETWQRLGCRFVCDPFVQDGEGVVAAALLGIGFVGYDPIATNQPGYTNLIEFLRKPHLSVLTTFSPSQPYDLIYVNPTKPINMDVKDWLLGTVFPLLRYVWTGLSDDGRIYVESSMYAQDIISYVDLDLGWRKGIPSDSVSRTQAFEYFRQHYGLRSLPIPPASVLDSIDDFPYYTRMDGFPTALVMFDNLRRGAHVFAPRKDTTANYVELTRAAMIKRKPTLAAADLTNLFNPLLAPSHRLEQLRSWYGAVAYTAPDEHERAATKAIFVRERINDARFLPRSLLDVGAGSGAISVAVAKSYGINSEKTFVVDPQAAASTQYQLLQYATDGAIPLDDGTVDLVILFRVMHHIALAHRDKLIAEIARVLAPGGMIVLQEHDSDYDPNYETYIGLLHDMDEIDLAIPQGPTHLMSRSELKMYMSQAGLFADPVRQYYDITSNPQRTYYDVYVKPSARAPIPLDSFVRSDTYILDRKWPDDYMTTDFISNHFSESQRMMCNIAGKPSALQYWRNLPFTQRENFLRRGTQYANDKVYDYICTNFNPTFCLDVILTLVGYNAKILDPSAGWGDRMIAALAARATYYTATDPNTLLQPAYQQIVETLGPLAGYMTMENIRKTFKVFPKYFESANVTEGFYDIALTSPPYYTYEEYHNARLDLSYPDWLQQVYRPYLANMVKGVKVSGYVVIYVGDISIDHTPYKLATDTILIMDEYVQQDRLRIMAPFGFRANTVTPQGNVRQGKVRTALVWRRLG